jgi:hypothetical protein
MNKLFSTIIIILVLTISSFAQNKTDWTFDGQVQLRSELDGRDFSNKTYPLAFTSMRTRLALKADISDRIYLYAQLQDSRIFGEEPLVTSNIKNLDLHQGYIKLIEPFQFPFSVQAGRFEMVYGTERFFGASNWTYIGRSFDGVRLSSGNETKLDIFALSTYEGTPYVSTASVSSYTFPENSDTGSSIYGFWLNSKLSNSNLIDFFTFYDINRKQSNGKSDDNKTTTIGFNHRGEYGSLSSLTEGAYESGSRGGIYLSAYLISVQGFIEFDAFKAGLGVDVLSGTNPKKKDRITTFYNSYGTAHLFNGYMDYFYKSPSSTYNLGLNDYFFTFKFAPKNNDFRFGIDYHSLHSNATSAGGVSDFGGEIDITASYELIKRASLTWGGSVFMPGSLMKSYFFTLRNQRDRTAFWSYIMISANF